MSHIRGFVKVYMRFIRMVPAFILHHMSTKERNEIVAVLQKQTGATIFDPVWLPDDPPRGCRESHVKIAAYMKEHNPESAYIVFEDDCEIIDPNFLSYRSLDPDADIFYFGFTHVGTFFKPPSFYIKCFFGTHAMYITPKARDLLLEMWEGFVKEGIRHIDQIWNMIQHRFALRVWKPDLQNRNKWVRQKPGIPSVGRHYNTH